MKTTASTGEIWTICVVMVVCLAFWLTQVWLAAENRSLLTLGRRYQVGVPEPVHDAELEPGEPGGAPELARGTAPGEARVPAQPGAAHDEPVTASGQVQAGERVPAQRDATHDEPVSTAGHVRRWRRLR